MSTRTNEQLTPLSDEDRRLLRMAITAPRWDIGQQDIFPALEALVARLEAPPTTRQTVRVTLTVLRAQGDRMLFVDENQMRYAPLLTTDWEYLGSPESVTITVEEYEAE